MKNFAAVATTAIAAMGLSAAALGLAGQAAAVPQGGSAADTVQQLQAEGYLVQINGIAGAPLSQCSVLGVSGLRGTESGGVRTHPTQADTAFVEVSCPSHD